jgi:aerobic carbon-monoxide dehydrogenase medium subunit
VKPGRFSYEAPATLGEALNSLATWRDNAKIIAGGQSLAPMLNMRLARPDHLIDINRLTELGRIRADDERLTIGAMVRHAQLQRDGLVKCHAPLLAYAAETIGHYAIRQRGTMGGSLAHADPAAQLPLAAVVLDAEFELRSAAGARHIGAESFFVSIFSTALEPDELLASIHIPLPRRREGWGFRLFNRRSGDFAIASVAATVARGEGSAIERLRLAIGGVGPVPLRVDDLVPRECATTLGEGWSARIAAAIAQAVEIEDNERTPIVFRRELVERLTRDALDEALERAS